MFDKKLIVQAILGMEERVARLRKDQQGGREIDRAMAEHDLASLEPALATFNTALSQIAANEDAPVPPLRIDWNRRELAEAYDIVETLRRDMAQDPDSDIDSTLRAALDALEAADCAWDGITKPNPIAA